MSVKEENDHWWSEKGGVMRGFHVGLMYKPQSKFMVEARWRIWMARLCDTTVFIDNVIVHLKLIAGCILS